MTEIKALLMSWVIALFPGMDPNLPQTYAGYVEADYLYVAPTATREILRLEVREGEEVEAGQFLFEQEDSLEAAALRAAEARRDAAAAELENLETGSRTAEIEVIRASLEQAKAEQTLALSNLARSQQLFEREIVTQAKVDTDRAALESANALVAELEARLEVAELPARDAQIVAARAQLNAAEADLDSARSALDDLKVVAPRGGLVEKIFYDAGEVAPAGSPVLSILPPGEMRILFYIPEPERLGFSLGMELAVDCDGCPDGMTATVTRMNTDPQYTPPIIYSRDERTRLVFRAEARLNADAALLPGQPVTLEKIE